MSQGLVICLPPQKKHAKKKGTSMPRTKENEEFDKWWKQWISTRAQGRIWVKPPSGKMPGADIERTADADPGNRV
jgi:hypothetical protein